MVLALSACAQDYQSFDEMALEMSKGTAPEITATTLNEADFSPVIFLDAREKAEYDVSHIKGALFVGYNNFELSNLPNLEKFTTIVVYCSVGYRSGVIGKKLRKLGFTSVFNLYGGLFDWVNNGNPVYSKSKKVTKVHPYNSKWGKWLNTEFHSN